VHKRFNNGYNELFHFNPESSLTTLWQKTLKNYHFLDKYQIFENYHFWTHVTVGPCSTLDWKNLRNFDRVECKISSFEVTKILLGGSYASQGHICIKKMSKMVVLFWIHSSMQVGYMLENFQIIWNCTI